MNTTSEDCQEGDQQQVLDILFSTLKINSFELKHHCSSVVCYFTELSVACFSLWRLNIWLPISKKKKKELERNRQDRELTSKRKSIFIVRQRRLAVLHSHLPNPLPILNIFNIFWRKDLMWIGVVGSEVQKLPGAGPGSATRVNWVHLECHFLPLERWGSELGNC